jgi:voltage-gated sodium channel
MSSKQMDMFILILIIIYTILVFANVSFEEEIDEYHIYLNVVELIILSFFGTEICLKIYAFGVKFLKDGWNIFDIIIVII